MIEIVDPDRALALSYVPTRVRPAMTALFALDERLARVVSATREAMLGQIRLAWWREALTALDCGAPVPNEPVLRAVVTDILPRGLSGAMLSGLVEGWEALIEDQPITAHGARGACLFALGTALLAGAGNPPVHAAGAGWALVDLGFHLSDRTAAEAALVAGRERLASGPVRWPWRLRPLGMLAVLAREDAVRGLVPDRRLGSPGRAVRMARHRLTGR